MQDFPQSGKQFADLFRWRTALPDARNFATTSELRERVVGHVRVCLSWKSCTAFDLNSTRVLTIVPGDV